MARFSRKASSKDELCYRIGENFRAFERQRNRLIETVRRLRNRGYEIPARLREVKREIQSLESAQNAARALGTVFKPLTLLLSEGLAQSIGLARERDTLEKEPWALEAELSQVERELSEAGRNLAPAEANFRASANHSSASNCGLGHFPW